MPAAPWKVGDALLVLGSGLGFLLLALIVTLGLAEIQTFDAGGWASRATVSTVVSLCFFAFILWMIWLLIVRRYRCSWRALGLRAVGWQWLATVPMINALVIFCFVLVLRAMVALRGPADSWPTPLTSATLAATQQPMLEALVILTGIVLAPVVEELLFRGVLYQAFRRRMSVGAASTGSALIFAAMHGNIVLFFPLVIMGVVLAQVYERSGSLLPAILVHACNNGFILLLYAARN